MRTLCYKTMRPIYDLTLEKSKICCLVGSDAAEKTKILDMIAGEKTSHGRIVINDSDFFIRSKRPRLADFIV